MSTAVRLKRLGRKKKPFYQIIVIDSRRRRDGRPIEILGWFNPFSDETSLNLARLDYWLSVGAQPSPRLTTIARKCRQSVPPAAETKAAAEASSL